MTLVTLWHPDGGALQVASDSRASFDRSFADVAVKITEIDLRRYASTPAGSPESFQPELLDERVLGLSVLGSLTSTFTCAAVLRPLLRGLQVAEGVTDYSLASIAEIVGAIFTRVAKDVCEAIFDKGEGAMVLIGRCPVLNEPAAYYISVALQGGLLTSSVTKLSTGPKPLFLGSPAAVKAAESILAQAPSLIGFRIVRRVCDDEDIRSVGGNVQFGAVDGKDFRTWGVQEFEVDDESRVVRAGFFVAGVEVMGPDDALNAKGFVPRHPFVSLFLPDLNFLLSRGYSMGHFGQR